jgi:hypothetical protein
MNLSDLGAGAHVTIVDPVAAYTGTVYCNSYCNSSLIAALELEDTWIRYVDQDVTIGPTYRKSPRILVPYHMVLTWTTDGTSVARSSGTTAVYPVAGIRTLLKRLEPEVLRAYAARVFLHADRQFPDGAFLRADQINALESVTRRPGPVPAFSRWGFGQPPNASLILDNLCVNQWGAADEHHTYTVERILSYVYYETASRLAVGIMPYRGAVATFHVRLLESFAGAGWRFEPAWKTRDAVGIAGEIRERESYADLPILADALQDAGCPETDPLLYELRRPDAVYGYHSRVFRELCG